MFERFTRSWALAGQCWGVLMGDKTLLVFPALSTLSLLAVTTSFALPGLALIRAAIGTALAPVKSMAVMGFLWYFVNFLIVFFFNTALVSVALKRLNGETATVADGLQLAVSRIPSIVMYAVIAASVGTVLKIVENRIGGIGRIVAGSVGFAWSIASAMVVPVLAAENVGPIDAIRRSVELLRRNWGENLIGNAGIGVVATFLFGVVIAAGGGLFVVGLKLRSITLMALGILGSIAALIAVSLVNSTLHSIYMAALYRYADGGKHSQGIDSQLLAGAFRRR